MGSRTACERNNYDVARGQRLQRRDLPQILSGTQIARRGVDLAEPLREKKTRTATPLAARGVTHQHSHLPVRGASYLPVELRGCPILANTCADAGAGAGAARWLVPSRTSR